MAASVRSCGCDNDETLSSLVWKPLCCRETTFLGEFWSNSAGWDVCKIKDYMSLDLKVNTDSLQSHKTLECRKEHKKVDDNLMWKQWDQCIKSLPIVVGRCCKILSFTSSLIFDARICAIKVMMRVAGRLPHPFSPIYGDRHAERQDCREITVCSQSGIKDLRFSVLAWVETSHPSPKRQRRRQRAPKYTEPPPIALRKWVVEQMENLYLPH